MDNIRTYRDILVRLWFKSCFPSEVLHVINDWNLENIEITHYSYSWDGRYSEIDSFFEGRRNGFVRKIMEPMAVM